MSWRCGVFEALRAHNIHTKLQLMSCVVFVEEVHPSILTLVAKLRFGCDEQLLHDHVCVYVLLF